jgi:hypothetical protein
MMLFVRNAWRSSFRSPRLFLLRRKWHLPETCTIQDLEIPTTALKAWSAVFFFFNLLFSFGTGLMLLGGMTTCDVIFKHRVLVQDLCTYNEVLRHHVPVNPTGRNLGCIIAVFPPKLVLLSSFNLAWNKQNGNNRKQLDIQCHT